MEKVNYDLFAKTFSNSRNNMKWEEIEYFLSKYFNFINKKSILDIGCGNGRLLDCLLKNKFLTDINYLGIDTSKCLIDEAKNKFGSDYFLVHDMLDLDKLKIENFESIFFIASFHHLLNIKERLKVLEKLKKIIFSGSYIFMTNWALESKINKEKYEKSLLKNSENKFLSKDFNIKIGKFERFYHSFNLNELEYLFKKTGYKIIENRLFDNNRNYISIIKI